MRHTGGNAPGGYRSFGLQASSLRQTPRGRPQDDIWGGGHWKKRLNLRREDVETRGDVVGEDDAGTQRFVDRRRDRSALRLAAALGDGGAQDEGDGAAGRRVQRLVGFHQQQPGAPQLEDPGGEGAEVPRHGRWQRGARRGLVERTPAVAIATRLADPRGGV